MRIRVTREFAGRLTDEKRIYPGEYEMGAPELFGVGRYLLDNGFAVSVDAPAFEDAPSPAPIIVDEIEFDDRTIQRFAPEGDGVDAIPDGASVVIWDDEPGASDVSGEAPTDYASWTNGDLLAEIERRDIGLKEDGGSGSKGAYVKADYVHILESDDEAKASA